MERSGPNSILRTAVVYVVVLLAGGSGIHLILEGGKALPSPRAALVAPTATEPAKTAEHGSASSVDLLSDLVDNAGSPLSNLLLQLVVILIATRLVGSLFTRLGQPSVIGEMIAGIMIGPSLFGGLFPGLFAFVFPDTSLGTLRLLSQLGVCLFMFLVGMELDLSHLRNQAHTAVVVSHVSIVFPYLLGVASALFLFSSFAAPGATFTSFALFMGISMSITAFPVLARILDDRGLANTFLGTTALTCAAVDDVSAWIILAFVVAIAKAGSVAGTLLTVALVIAFAATMLLLVRPRLARWIGDDAPGKGVLAGSLALMLCCALATEVIGIHALFGAFVAGVAMPDDAEFRRWLHSRIESLCAVFLLPLFFAFTGLRMKLGLLNDAEAWIVCLGVIGVATVGKLGGSMLAARFTGMSWSDAFAIGALMNTRGLMELIALNIGYDLGILSPRMFAILVLMALVTTFLTGPLLTLGERLSARSRATQGALVEPPTGMAAS